MKTIDDVLAALQWAVYRAVSRDANFQITSDPWERSHTFHFPAHGDRVREIEYLHELAHAYLAERVHPLVSTAFFVPGIPDHVIQSLVWPKRCAADWYADALLFEWMPDVERAEVREHLGYILQTDTNSLNEPDWEFWRFSGGLMIAQALHWKLRTIRVPEFYSGIVDALLSIDPDKPSLKRMQKLLNRLAAITTPYQVSLAESDGMDVWDVRRIDTTK